MLNKVQLIGNLGKDPESKQINDELMVCNFTIATSKKVKGESKTEWHNIVVFNKLAEICSKYLVKGKQVYIEGEIQTRSWEDKEGNKRYSTEIIGNQMLMMSGKGAESSPPSEEPKMPF